jgi:hypothetical protein
MRNLKFGKLGKLLYTRRVQRRPNTLNSAPNSTERAAATERT